MGKWVLYTQPNHAHFKPTHLTPLYKGVDYVHHFPIVSQHVHYIRFLVFGLKFVLGFVPYDLWTSAPLLPP